MRRYVIIAIVCLMPLQAIALDHPSVSELLRKYAQTQDKLKSYIVKAECTVFADNLFTTYNRDLTGKWKKNQFLEFRTDGNRAYRGEETWGDANIGIGRTGLTRDKANCRSWLWDGKQYLVSTSWRGDTHSGSLTIYIGRQAHAFGKELALSCQSTFRNDIEGEKIDSFLRKALQRSDKVFVLERKEKVGGSDCYVIEAVTKKYGTHKLWIDPEHGYHIAKSKHRKVNQSGGSRHGAAGSVTYSSSEVVRFEKIEGIWIPMEENGEHGKKTRGGEYSKRKIHTKVIEVALNPDHDALGSFVLNVNNIRNGAEVTIYSDKKRKEYTWQDGQVVDKNGRKVNYLPKKSAGKNKRRLRNTQYEQKAGEVFTSNN